jgi:hypothetical protein
MKWQQKEREASLTPRAPGTQGCEGQLQPGPVYGGLNSTRISVKNDATTRISKLTSGKQVHLKTRNMRNIRNRERGSRKSASTGNRERGTISRDNMNRRNKRAKSRKNRRRRGHMKRSSRIQIPRG